MGKPRLSRENSELERRRMRNERKKRKRKVRKVGESRAERNLGVDQLHREREEARKAKVTCEYMARRYYDRWRRLARASSVPTVSFVQDQQVICRTVFD